MPALQSGAIMDLGLGDDLANQASEEAVRLKKLRQKPNGGGASDHPYGMPGAWGSAAASLGLM